MVTYYVSMTVLNWYSARKPKLPLRHFVVGLKVVPAVVVLGYHPFVNVVEVVPGAVPPQTLNSQSRPQYLNWYLCDLKLMVAPGEVLPLGRAVVPVMREFVHNGQNSWGPIICPPSYPWVVALSYSLSSIVYLEEFLLYLYSSHNS